MKRFVALLFVVIALVSIAPVWGAEEQSSETTEKSKHPFLMYIPNRIFDVFDMVRLRVRLGPGLSVGARVDSIAELFVGEHSTVYVGLPGPRGKPAIPMPFGMEDNSGKKITTKKTVEPPSEYTPYYGPLEVGAETQALLVGISLGVEPLELIDLVAGFLFIDLKGDDY